MRKKRKYGYILLTSLIISGLAGTPTDNSLTKKERTYGAELMRITKSDVLKAVKDLSEAQLNYRSAPDKWTAKESIYHIAISEKSLWGILETSLKSTANPEKRGEIKITDEQLVKMMEDKSFKEKTAETFEPKHTPYKTLEEALSFFKEARTEHIKYLKNTTEDLRNHVVQMPFGWLDCYQLCLMIASYSNRHTQQINEIKADAGFPK